MLIADELSLNILAAMRDLLLLSYFCLASLPELNARSIAPADTSQFSCKIYPNKKVYKRGERIASSVELWNNTTTSQTFATAVDGFEVGWRYSSIMFEVYKLRRNSAKKQVKPRVYVRCGNIDGISEADFVNVPPGGKLNP